MCVNNDLKTLVLLPADLAGIAHKEGSPLSLGSQGDPERGRTSDLQIRNLSLYPLSYGINDWLLVRLQIASEVWPLRKSVALHLRFVAVCQG